MGAWSTRIFDNDTYADVIGDYKKLLGYKVPHEEAYHKIYDYYAKDYIGKDDEDDFWLALAYFQWKNGFLMSEVKENALRCIDSEEYLERWKESGKKIYEKRKEILKIFKNKMMSEVNPLKKSFPKPPLYLRDKTDWKVGDHISYQITAKRKVPENNDLEKMFVTHNNMYNKYFLLRVVDVYKAPVSKICPELDYYSEPIVMLYDWYGDEEPINIVTDNLNFIPICTSMNYRRFAEKKEEQYIMMLSPAVSFSKDPNKRVVSRTKVIGNDPSYINNKPKLYTEHGESAGREFPEGFNLCIGRTYAGFEYEKKFWNE